MIAIRYPPWIRLWVWESKEFTLSSPDIVSEDVSQNEAKHAFHWFHSTQPLMWLSPWDAGRSHCERNHLPQRETHLLSRSKRHTIIFLSLFSPDNEFESAIGYPAEYLSCLPFYASDDLIARRKKQQSQNPSPAVRHSLCFHPRSLGLLLSNHVEKFS